jgi:hypothetical protein
MRFSFANVFRSETSSEDAPSLRMLPPILITNSMANHIGWKPVLLSPVVSSMPSMMLRH